MALVTCCPDAKVGEAVSIFSKVLHHQDPTQLLIKELTGNVVRSGDGCIMLGEYAVYEENLKLEQTSPAMREGTAEKMSHFYCDLLVLTSGLSPPHLPTPWKYYVCMSCCDFLFPQHSFQCHICSNRSSGYRRQQPSTSC
jgi:RNase P subunit RPR2